MPELAGILVPTRLTRLKGALRELDGVAGMRRQRLYRCKFRPDLHRHVATANADQHRRIKLCVAATR